MEFTDLLFDISLIVSTRSNVGDVTLVLGKGSRSIGTSFMSPRLSNGESFMTLHNPCVAILSQHKKIHIQEIKNLVIYNIINKFYIININN